MEYQKDNGGKSGGHFGKGYSRPSLTFASANCEFYDVADLLILDDMLKIFRLF